MSNPGSGWASPAPAGLIALAVACFTFFAMFTGRVEHSALPLLGIWLIGGFFVQVVVAIIEFKEGALAGGNVFLYFSAYFMLVTGLECLFKFWMASKGITLDAHMDGWAWIPLTIGLITWTPAYFKSPPVMTLCVVAVDVAVIFVTLKDLAILGPGAAPIAGWALLIAGIFGLWMAAGVILNTTFGKPIIPLGKPLVK
jgi:succinate-acetate transporter protein